MYITYIDPFRTAKSGTKKYKVVNDCPDTYKLVFGMEAINKLKFCLKIPVVWVLSIIASLFYLPKIGNF